MNTKEPMLNDLTSILVVLTREIDFVQSTAASAGSHLQSVPQRDTITVRDSYAQASQKNACKEQ